MRLVLFRFLLGRLTNRHTGENRVASAVMITFGEEFLKGIGCDEIIVLIVLIVLIVPIVTVFLNEAKSFSLINATQILSIGGQITVWNAFSLKSSIYALNPLGRVLFRFF